LLNAAKKEVSLLVCSSGLAVWAFVSCVQSGESTVYCSLGFVMNVFFTVFLSTWIAPLSHQATVLSDDKQFEVVITKLLVESIEAQKQSKRERLFEHCILGVSDDSLNLG